MVLEQSAPDLDKPSEQSSSSECQPSSSPRKVVCGGAEQTGSTWVIHQVGNLGTIELSQTVKDIYSKPSDWNNFTSWLSQWC